MSLTNLEISPVRGNAALLPNQPVLQGCIVSAAETATLVPGDVVTLADVADANDRIIVKKAAVTDLPFGVVAGNAVKTGFVAKDMVSIFPEGSYVNLVAGGAIARGAKLQFTVLGKVDDTSEADNGYIGIALTKASADGDNVIVKIKPSI